jgi:hypothetical protein
LIADADRALPSAFAHQYKLYFRKDLPSFPEFLLTSPDPVAAS